MEGERSILLIGDQVLAFSHKRPYPGWGQLRPQVAEIIEHIKGTQLVSEIERFSIKYVNVLPIEGIAHQLQMLKLEIVLGPHNLVQHQSQIRTEIELNGFTNILQIVPHTTVNMPNEKPVEGLLFDIDTIYMKSLGKNWDALPDLLDKAHSTEKKLFFDTLTAETIQRFEPAWE